VGRRADRVIRQATEAGGDVALFISAREEKERKMLFPLFVALTFALSLAVMALAETKSDSARHNRSANVVWEFPAVNSL